MFGVATEQIHSGCLYIASSHLMSISHLHCVLSSSDLYIYIDKYILNFGKYEI